MALRPAQMRKGPVKKLTKETLRSDPLMAALARKRAKETRDLRREKGE